MSLVDDTPPDRTHDSLDQLRHGLKTPLTTILGRAYLLARAIQRTPSLADGERMKMLEELAMIEAGVQTMVAHIDGMDSAPSDGPTDSTGAGNSSEEDQKDLSGIPSR